MTFFSDYEFKKVQKKDARFFSFFYHEPCSFVFVLFQAAVNLFPFNLKCGFFQTSYENKILVKVLSVSVNQ